MVAVPRVGEAAGIRARIKPRTLVLHIFPGIAACITMEIMTVLNWAGFVLPIRVIRASLPVDSMLPVQHVTITETRDAHKVGGTDAVTTKTLVHLIAIITARATHGIMTILTHVPIAVGTMTAIMKPMFVVRVVAVTRLVLLPAVAVQTLTTASAPVECTAMMVV